MFSGCFQAPRSSSHPLHRELYSSDFLTASKLVGANTTSSLIPRVLIQLNRTLDSPRYWHEQHDRYPPRILSCTPFKNRSRALRNYRSLENGWNTTVRTPMRFFFLTPCHVTADGHPGTLHPPWTTGSSIAEWPPCFRHRDEA